jgi:2-polyprenyl-3-methyl-5-hydroxy-6-metoxy-1,4-benzoquinol methylase
MRDLAFEIFNPFLKEGIGLELGCSDGYMTEMLAGKLSHLDVVDGSGNFLKEARARGTKNVSFYESLFESFKSEKKYDYVFASYILEHVLETKPVLDMIRSVLKPEGILFVVVPNARAFSRQLALAMGLISDLYALTENDRNHGHRRTYDRQSLNRDLEQSGFKHIAQGGIMFKILADFQMDKLISDGFLKESHIKGLQKMGNNYPDFCGSLFSICRIV